MRRRNTFFILTLGIAALATLMRLFNERCAHENNGNSLLFLGSLCAFFQSTLIQPVTEKIIIDRPPIIPSLPPEETLVENPWKPINTKLAKKIKRDPALHSNTPEGDAQFEIDSTLLKKAWRQAYKNPRNRCTLNFLLDYEELTFQFQQDVKVGIAAFNWITFSIDLPSHLQTRNFDTFVSSLVHESSHAIDSLDNLEQDRFIFFADGNNQLYHSANGLKKIAFPMFAGNRLPPQAPRTLEDLAKAQEKNKEIATFLADDLPDIRYLFELSRKNSTSPDSLSDEEKIRLNEFTSTVTTSGYQHTKSLVTDPQSNIKLFNQLKAKFIRNKKGFYILRKEQQATVTVPITALNIEVANGFVIEFVPDHKTNSHNAVLCLTDPNNFSPENLVRDLLLNIWFLYSHLTTQHQPADNSFTSEWRAYFSQSVHAFATNSSSLFAALFPKTVQLELESASPNRKACLSK